jgi:alpha-tubulin suppressor-like RCC1 family protein
MVSRLSPLPVVAIACGSFHSLAVTSSGSLYSWGWSRRGQTGVGTTNDVMLPYHITVPKSFAEERIISCSAGSNFSVAITQSGHLYTWGGNEHGQLGVSSVDSFFIPTKVLSVPPPLPLIHLFIAFI